MLQTQLEYVFFRPTGTCDLCMKNMVLLPTMCLILGRDFTTLFGISIPHSLALEQDQISSDGNLKSLSRESCFPADSCGVVVRALM